MLLGNSFTPLTVAGALATLLLVDGALGRLIGGAQTLLQVAIPGRWSRADALAVVEMRQVTFTHGARVEPGLRSVWLTARPPASAPTAAPTAAAVPDVSA